MVPTLKKAAAHEKREGLAKEREAPVIPLPLPAGSAPSHFISLIFSHLISVFYGGIIERRLQHRAAAGRGVALCC